MYNNNIIILIGKSGCGKDSLLNMFLNIGYNKIISYTNRPNRVNEINNIDYHFVTKQFMIDSISVNKFFQYRSYTTLFNDMSNTWYYATDIKDISAHKKYVVVVDLEGAKQYIKIFGDRVQVFYIHLDDNIRMNRAIKRGSFCQKEWDRRLKDDNIRFSKKELLTLGIKEEDYILNTYDILDTFSEIIKKRRI